MMKAFHIRLAGEDDFTVLTDCWAFRQSRLRKAEELKSEEQTRSMIRDRIADVIGDREGEGVVLVAEVRGSAVAAAWFKQGDESGSAKLVMMGYRSPKIPELDLLTVDTLTVRFIEFAGSYFSHPRNGWDCDIRT